MKTMRAELNKLVNRDAISTNVLRPQSVLFHFHWKEKYCSFFFEVGSKFNMTSPGRKRFLSQMHLMTVKMAILSLWLKAARYQFI